MATNKLTPRQEQALKIVRASPMGIKSKDAARQMGLEHGHGTTILRALRKLGLAAPTTSGHTAVWLTAERAAVWKDERERSAAELKRVAQIAACKTARRAKERAQREAVIQAEQAAFESLPVHRIISALDAPRITPRQPASVFTLAAC